MHINDDKQRIATIDGDVVRYQLSDHLGSASLELDENAEIISYEEYYPFGASSYRSGRSETEVSQKRYKYVMKELDNETGLYYYGMRYYASWLARFISVDPLQHEYPYYTPFQYAGNKPITFIDLDGAEEAEVVGPGYYSASVKTRYIGFGFRHPLASMKIGFGVTPGATNISTNAVRFATRGEILQGSKREERDEGSENGAFRHTLWQATITSEFDRSVAAQAGYAHEKNPFANLNVREFKSLEDADETVDLLNNIIGRNIGEANKGLKMNELAILVLDEFANEGLYTASQDENGNWIISKTKLSLEKYNQLKEIFKNLDENGRTQEEQEELNKKNQQHLKELQTIWGTMK